MPRKPVDGKKPAKRLPAGVLRKKISPNAIWTLRCLRHGHAEERHYGHEAAALEAALNMIEKETADPQHLRADDVLVYTQEELYDLWVEKYLGA